MTGRGDTWGSGAVPSYHARCTRDLFEVSSVPPSVPGRNSRTGWRSAGGEGARDDRGDTRQKHGVKKMGIEAHPVVPPVKPDAVADVEPLHRAAQVGLPRFHQQVIMVVHQHLGMNPQPEPLGQLPQQLQKTRAVGVLPVNGLSLVAASRNVVAPTRTLEAQCPCHPPSQPPPAPNVKFQLSDVEM